jgi:hypothetical protein
LYSELHNAISNNASQATKIPVEAPLTALVKYLSQMEVGQLSLQQLALLEEMGVLKLIGPDGAKWIETVVRAESYDPATTNQNVAKAVEAISAGNQKLQGYSAAVDQLGFARRELDDEDGRITVRIGFRNDASIKNVKDWKVSADDWYQIVRGLAMATGEAPEDTKVVGASTGSIILILSATYAFSKILAAIARHITGAAKEILTLQMSVEDLRQKKILTKTMEAEFQKLQSEVRAKAEKTIETEIKKLVLGAADGEKANAVTKSVQKLLKFGEDGGDIDFVAPPAADDESEEDDPKSDDMIAAIAEVRNAIASYQNEREAVKLLSNRKVDNS